MWGIFAFYNALKSENVKCDCIYIKEGEEYGKYKLAGESAGFSL